jgi:UDP-glucose 4-epimerase
LTRASSATVQVDLRGAYDGRKVCVTGGAGFIGSHLVEALVRHGASVTVIDDLSSGHESNLQPVRSNIRFVRGSILDESAMRSAVEGCDVIFHEAALCSVPRSVEQPALYAEVNTTGTLRVLEAARAAGIKRVVYAASSSSYGDAPTLPKVESMPIDCLSPYAASKQAGEQLVRAYAACYGIGGVSLRYFNIFGPRQRPDSPYAAVIPLFTDALLHKRTPKIYGDGKQTRDFTHVGNAVHANLLAGAVERDLRGQIINVGCGAAFSLLDLLASIGRALGVDAAAEFAPPRAGDVRHSLADISLARSLLGYEPVVEFDAGLRETVAWMAQDRASVADGR